MLFLSFFAVVVLAADSQFFNEERHIFQDNNTGEDLDMDTLTFKTISKPEAPAPFVFHLSRGPTAMTSPTLKNPIQSFSSSAATMSDDFELADMQFEITNQHRQFGMENNQKISMDFQEPKPLVRDEKEQKSIGSSATSNFSIFGRGQNMLAVKSKATKHVSFNKAENSVREFVKRSPMIGLKPNVETEPSVSILRKRRCDSLLDERNPKKANLQRSEDQIDGKRRIYNGLCRMHEVLSPIHITDDQPWEIYEFVGKPNPSRIVLFNLDITIKHEDICKELDVCTRNKTPAFLEVQALKPIQDCVQLVLDECRLERPFAFVVLRKPEYAQEVIKAIREFSSGKKGRLGLHMGVDLAPMIYDRTARTVQINFALAKLANKLWSLNTEYWRKRGMPLCSSTYDDQTRIGEIIFHQANHAEIAIMELDGIAKLKRF